LYKIFLTRSAEKEYIELAGSNPAIFKRVRSALKYIAENPRSGKPLKLKLKGKWSYRVGPYRIIYSIEHGRLVVYVLSIGHRRDVYT
jgi:mRNA interferase RelE/StbE